MTHTCCSACRLRFSRGGSTLVSCPFCEGALEAASARALVGFKLITFDDLVLDDLAVETALALARARAAALPAPSDR